MQSKLKGLITAVVCSLAYVGVAYCSSVKSQETYSVGGQMPTRLEGTILGEKGWRTVDGTKRGKYYGMDLDGDWILDLNVAYLNCPEKERGPFGAYIFKTKQLLFDRDMDGNIDEIVDYNGRKMSQDAPDC